MAWRQQVQLYWQALAVNGVGEKSTTFHTQLDPAPSFGAAEDVFIALGNLSVGNLKTARICPIQTFAGSPGPGAYSSINDYAKVFFRCADGTTCELIFPAPREDIWLPGQDRMDLSDGLVQALIDAAIVSVSNGVGSPVIAAEDGRRYKIKV